MGTNVTVKKCLTYLKIILVCKTNISWAFKILCRSSVFSQCIQNAVCTVFIELSSTQYRILRILFPRTMTTLNKQLAARRFLDLLHGCAGDEGYVNIFCLQVDDFPTDVRFFLPAARMRYKC